MSQRPWTSKTQLVSELDRTDDVQEVVAADPLLTAKLLNLANSALHGNDRRIGTVRDAVLRIGSGSVMALAMASGARRMLAAAPPPPGLRPGELWMHSIACTFSATCLPSQCAVSINRCKSISH